MPFRRGGLITVGVLVGMAAPGPTGCQALPRAEAAGPGGWGQVSEWLTAGSGGPRIGANMLVGVAGTQAKGGWPWGLGHPGAGASPLVGEAGSLHSWLLGLWGP